MTRIPDLDVARNQYPVAEEPPEVPATAPEPSTVDAAPLEAPPQLPDGGQVPQDLFETPMRAVPNMAEVIKGNTVLQTGDYGQPVKEIQKYLNMPQTSVFDDNTRAAVEAFQKKHKLPADGVVDLNTLRALKLAQPKPLYGTQLELQISDPKRKEALVHAGGLDPERLKPVPTDSKIVEEAMKMLGTAYVWGHSSKKSCDCSGFTYLAYKNAGVAQGAGHNKAGVHRLGSAVR